MPAQSSFLSIINNYWMGFCDIWNNQGQGKYNQDITKTESNYIIVLLYTFLKKITTNTPLQGT